MCANVHFSGNELSAGSPVWDSAPKATHISEHFVAFQVKNIEAAFTSAYQVKARLMCQEFEVIIEIIWDLYNTNGNL